ncbi:nitrate reductase gamma subunit [Desulfitispora alkaliphila]|uniref:sulfate reduction electron transfer complex DsrMKJOP subunit DsrM n=1 Tax=Desulfitispora alkaliphila TaxID=622674 RepID=UPI003D1D640E
MGIMFSAFVVIALILSVYLGVEAGGLHVLFGVIIPYAAFVTFLLGVILRVLKWAKSPVPFRIPTTCGQQKSLDWIEPNKLDNPTTKAGVVGRMALEVLLFRSLFRNTKSELHDHNGPKLAYGWEKWLWLAGLAFHWSFFFVVVRHLRFFLDPVPGFILAIEGIDGFFQVGLQGIQLTGLILLAAVTFLFFRRVALPQVKYISLPADYIPLFLIMGIAGTGIMMRYFVREDVAAVKELTMGLVTFSPTVPDGISSIFYIHMFLVAVLFAYFPFSKLMHAGGVFMSPTRNMVNNNRAERHVNPWNYPVKVHTYEEYENDYRKVMKATGIPVDKEDDDEDKSAG